MTQYFIQYFTHHFYGGYDLNTLWSSCAFETGNHDQNANIAWFFKRERICIAKNFGWGVQTTQHFSQHLKTMELLATVTQHFWLESNFTQHRKSQCWVTQHGVQTIQHCTQHEYLVNAGWIGGSYKQAYRFHRRLNRRFHTHTSVGRKMLLNMSKECCRFSHCSKVL